MDFASRIKKEMSEGIVRALLEDAGYRVIDTGIEKVIRELCCLNSAEYSSLEYPDAMRSSPDFVVMDKEQTEKQLVEVKYRRTWDVEILEEVRDQVKAYRELTLVYVNGEGADDPLGYNSPTRYIRCCRLKFESNIYQAEVRRNNKEQKRLPRWVNLDEEDLAGEKWWLLSTPQETFNLLAKNRGLAYAALDAAVSAMGGILGMDDKDKAPA